MSIFKNRQQSADHFGAVAYDLLNFGESPIEFRDQHPDRRFGARSGFPETIIIPGGHMACIPDEFFVGKTMDGKNNSNCFRLYGAKRPLRKLMGGVSMYDSEVYEIPAMWMNENSASKPKN